MKDTDKITLSVGSIKRLIKEAKTSSKKKIIKESIGIDVIDDLAERAQSGIDDEGLSATEAVKEAIADGLIYTDDIIALLGHYGTIKDDEIIDSYYDRLFDDVMNLVEEPEEDEDIDDEDVEESIEGEETLKQKMQRSMLAYVMKYNDAGRKEVFSYLKKIYPEASPSEIYAAIDED